MILELDTSVLDRIPNLSINQLVFLMIVLNMNQYKYQDVRELLSRVSEDEIQSLIFNDLISKKEVDNNIIYNITDKYRSLVKAKDETMFDEFYELYPVYVIRPDGTKGFLRANINKCRREYNKIVGKSRAMHQHLTNCLRYEVEQKQLTGKLSYMKTMWKWITQNEWEVIEEQMKEDPNSRSIENNEYYGQTIY